MIAMPSELWSAVRMAKEFGFTGPGSVHAWRIKMDKAGTPIPIAAVTIDRGRRTHLYDSEVAMAARAADHSAYRTSP